MDNPQATRRGFLKTSVAVAGTALATEFIAGNAHAASSSDAIKVGLIGCGGRGSGAADNVLHSAPNVHIHAIGDAFHFRTKACRSRLQRLAQSAEVKQLGNTADIPEERCFAGLDAFEKVINSGANYIILATPPGFRPQFLEAAVAAGKNIFTEKPVATDGPGLRKVFQAYEDAKKKGLHIVAGTQRRHQAGYIETMKRVLGGEIGEITSLRAYWDQGGLWFRPRKELTAQGEKATDLAYQLHNWYQFVWVCGDHIVEQHVHNLDVCHWAMGKPPVKAVGMGARSVRPHGDTRELGHIYDFFAVDFEYDNGVHMLSTCRQIPGCENNVSEAIVGTKGVCQANTHTINGKRVAQRGGKDPYVQEHTDLIEAIRAGKPINELKTVAESTLTAILGRTAAYTGKVVTAEQVLHAKEALVPEKLSWDMSMPEWQVAVPGKTRLA